MLRSLFKKAFGLIKIIFLNFTYQITVFVIGLLLINMLQVCYKIKDLNYLIIISLLLSGIAIYYLCERILKSTKYKIAAVCILSVSIIVFYGVYNYKANQYAVYLYTLLKEISTAIYKSKDTFGYQYMPFMVALLPLCTAAFIYLYEHRKGYISALAGLSFLLVLWYTGFDYEIRNFSYPYLFLIAVIFTISMYKASIYDFSIKKYKITVSRKRITFYMIFCCLMIAFCGIIFKEAFGVRSIPEIVEEAAAKYSPEKVETGDSYDLSKSGYSENIKKLGGSLAFDTNIAMRVKTDTQLYLRGTVKDNYNGSVWTKSPSRYVESNGSYIVNSDNQYNEYLNGSKNSKEPILREKIVIYPESINVSTLFAPLYTLNIVPAKGSFQFDESNSFLFQGGQIVKKPYTVEYIRSTGKILKPGTNGDEEKLILYDSGEKMDDVQKVYYDEHVKKVYEKYLQLPVSITDDTIKLVNSITSDCKSSSEKVIKIKEYLSQNYVYSPEVPVVPQGKDFLDYFLFNEKKGYCTYFATASTVMCRIAGIPARYVEGFRMGPEKDEEGLYVVGNEMAHAWTEILASPESDIWITLDSTPMRDQSVTMGERQITGTGRKWGISARRTVTDGDTYGKVQISGFWGTIFFCIPLLFFFLIASYIVYSLISYHKKIKQICNSRSTVPIYNYTKIRLKAAGFQQFLSVDDERWIESINDDTLKGWLRIMVDAAYTEFYGNKQPKDFDKRGMYNYIEAYIKGKQNIFRYIFKKYFS